MLLDWKQECPKWETTIMDLGTYAMVPPLWANLKKMFGENGHRSGCILICKRIFFHFKQAAT